MSPPFSFEIKGKHRSKGAFVSPTMLYSTISLYFNFGFMRSFPYHQYPKFVSQILTKNVTQVGASECKTRAIVCKHNYNFLCSAGNLDCYASFVMVVSLLSKRIHDLHNVCDGSV